MARPLRPGSPITMPGVPDEEENKNKVPFAPAADNEQAQGEQTLQQLANTPPVQPAAPQPEDDVASYQRLSKQAEEAVPSEEDVLAASMRRTGAQLRAEAPAYLEKAAETLFYKPDYSQITRVAEGEAKQPDMVLSAKEQAQKRLEALAEGARKRALLPAEIGEKQAKTLKTQEELRTLKQKGAPLSEERRKLYEGMINSFISRNNLGDPVSLPEAVTEEDANRLLISSKSGDTTSWRAARLEFDKGEAERRQQRFLMGYEQKGEEKAEKALAKEFTFEGLPYKGRTEKEAQELRNKIAATNSVFTGMDKIKKVYGEIPTKKLSEVPKAVQDIGVRGRDLIMQIKEVYGLGAPQEGELKFLYNLVETGSGPVAIGKAILSDEIIGTSLPEKLDSLRDQFNTYVKENIAAKAISKEPTQTSKSTSNLSKSATKPAKPVVIQKGQPLPD